MDIEKIAAARLYLASRRPYLASAIWTLSPVPISGMGTFAVDRYWRLYYDPELDIDVKTVATGLYHEVFHLLRDHIGRSGAIDDISNIIWNLAGDCEINDDIVNENEWSLIEGAITPDIFSLPEGKLAEFYYENLLNNKAARELAYKILKDMIAMPGAGQCGSAAGGQVRPWESEGDARGERRVGNAERGLIARRVAEAVKSIGTATAGWQRWADEILNPKINWRAQLRAYILNAVADIAGRVDYTYRRPSRRQMAFGNVIMPSMIEPTVKVAVVVDTSGSMSDNELTSALSEIKGIIDAVGITGVDVLSVDADVHNVQKVFSAKSVKLFGGGGTNMGVGITKASELRPRPDIIIVLTDGYTPWPDTPPPQRVIVGIINDEDMGAPAWAKKVLIRD